MPSTRSLTVAAKKLRNCLFTRSGSTSAGPGRRVTYGENIMNRTPPPPGQSRKWQGWEIPFYITSYVTIFILGGELRDKPDLSIETLAHQKALERLELEKLASDGDEDSSD